MAYEVKVVVKWPLIFRENGAEQICTASVKVDFCHLKGVLIKVVIYRSKRAANIKNMIEETPYNRIYFYFCFICLIHIK